MFGTIASFAGNLFGDLMGQKSDRDINKANLNEQRRINAENIAFQRESQAQNEALQREFAQMGIRWKVDDAKAAGLHPLSALGTQTSSYSPTITTPSSVAAEQRSTGHHLSNMGQSVANAIRAMQPEEKLRRRLELQRLSADVDKTFAEAAYWRSQAAGELGGSPGSAKPLAGGAEFDAVDHAVASPISHFSGDPSREAGEHSFWRTYILKDGSRVDLPTQEAAEALENIHVTGLPIAYRNWIRPFFGRMMEADRKNRELYRKWQETQR